MGLLDELDKYRSVFELIKNNESYDKKNNVLTGEEVFKLCQNRYDSMQNILRPLQKRLGENIEIIEIGFAQIAEEETPRIVVRYQKDGLQNFFSISNLGLKDIEISSGDNRLESLNFVLINKGMILEIFNKLFEDSMYDEISINSTSKRFTIVDTMKNFIIKDINGKLLSIEGSHPIYAKEGLMYNKEKIITPNPKLKEALLDDENIMNVYRHLRVYEDDIPKILIKKTN
jgi:hypothetical protein